MGLAAKFLRVWVIASLTLAVGCQPPTPHAEASQQFTSAHDLIVDEQHGGHTLSRHIGRTDDQLRERLERERNISAASTYTDRSTAERVIAAALKGNSERIQRWLERGPTRPNLVLDYADPNEPIGRVMFRRAMGSVPCDQALVVLKAEGDSYYVLTSYPECKP